MRTISDVNIGGQEKSPVRLFLDELDRGAKDPVLWTLAVNLLTSVHAAEQGDDPIRTARGFARFAGEEIRTTRLEAERRYTRTRS